MDEVTYDFTVKLGLTTLAGLGTYAADMEADGACGSLAAELIREGLLARGYLINDSGLVRLPGDATGQVAKPDPVASTVVVPTAPPFVIPPTE